MSTHGKSPIERIEDDILSNPPPAIGSWEPGPRGIPEDDPVEQYVDQNLKSVYDKITELELENAQLRIESLRLGAIKQKLEAGLIVIANGVVENGWLLVAPQFVRQVLGWDKTPGDSLSMEMIDHRLECTGQDEAGMEQAHGLGPAADSDGEDPDYLNCRAIDDDGLE